MNYSVSAPIEQCVCGSFYDGIHKNITNRSASLGEHITLNIDNSPFIHNKIAKLIDLILSPAECNVYDELKKLEYLCDFSNPNIQHFDSLKFREELMFRIAKSSFIYDKIIELMNILISIPIKQQRGIFIKLERSKYDIGIQHFKLQLQKYKDLEEEKIIILQKLQNSLPNLQVLPVEKNDNYDDELQFDMEL